MSHPVIQAKAVRLRPASHADVATLRSFFDDPGFNEHWGGAPLPDHEIIAKYTGLRSPEVECFLVERNNSDIGLVQYCVADGGSTRGGIDLALTPSARGLGIGTTVVYALVDFLRMQRGWTRITVDPDVSNPDGVRFWTTVGFEREQLVEDDPERDPYVLMSWPESPNVR